MLTAARGNERHLIEAEPRNASLSEGDTPVLYCVRVAGLIFAAAERGVFRGGGDWGSKWPGRSGLVDPRVGTFYEPHLHPHATVCAGCQATSRSGDKRKDTSANQKPEEKHGQATVMEHKRGVESGLTAKLSDI